MLFQTSESIPIKCPECLGAGRLPYPSFLPYCPKCQGVGYLVEVTLTYPESTDTAGNPVGRMFYGGKILRPYTTRKKQSPRD
jgi:hypothetical protein